MSGIGQRKAPVPRYGPEERITRQDNGKGCFSPRSQTAHSVAYQVVLRNAGSGAGERVRVNGTVNLCGTSRAIGSQASGPAPSVEVPQPLLPLIHLDQMPLGYAQHIEHIEQHGLGTWQNGIGIRQ